MRFKTIFLIFNIVIVASFLFIFFMPLFLLGGEHFGGFVVKNWISGVLFLIALIGFNLYFVGNWNLFSLLEREDWPALIGFLEDGIFNRGRLSRRYIKILINAYLVTSNTEAIVRLYSHLSTKRPDVVPQFAIPFGIPYLIQNNPEESERYFGKMLSENGVKEKGWIRWDYAFSLIQLKELDAARKELSALVEKKSDPILHLLALYMLDSLSASSSSTRALLQEKLQGFRSTHNVQSWNRRIERSKDNMQVLILSRIIKEASDWAFGATEQTRPA